MNSLVHLILIQIRFQNQCLRSSESNTLITNSSLTEAANLQDSSNGTTPSTNVISTTESIALADAESATHNYMLFH